MKKLIYLILFLPVIGFSQTYPYQIEPDTTHRIIMMTDTSVIDSPFMEFQYFSIDSLVEQIARDTLGLDSSYWELSSDYSVKLKKWTTGKLYIGEEAGDGHSLDAFAIGYRALRSGTATGSGNFALGNFAMGNNALTTGFSNMAIGNFSLQNLTTGSQNVSVGVSAGASVTTGDDNTLVGYLAGSSVGSDNVMVGTQTGVGAGSFNTMIGYQAGQNNTNNSNVFIGRRAGRNNTGFSNVFIGLAAGQSESGNNKLIIDNNGVTPLIYGEFDNNLVTINNDLYVNSLNTSDYLYSTSDQILGGNWVDGDWTLTGNIDTLFFGDPSNIDTVVVSAGDPDQTLSFSDPDLTISGSGGNTIDISGVNYWDTNADGIYTTQRVGINTTPHATHPFYVTGTMWLDGPVRDGNGSFASGLGNIMTSNSSGEFLWSPPSAINLSDFNNDLGLTQYWSLVSGELFSNTGGAARNIVVDEIDFNFGAGTANQLMGRVSSTGKIAQISVGTGLSLSSGILTATNTSPWTDNGTYVSTTNNENVYIADNEALLVGTTTESSYAVDIASNVEMRLLGDLFDKNTNNGDSGDILTSDGDQIEWIKPAYGYVSSTSEETTTSTTYTNKTGFSGSGSGFTPSTSGLTCNQTGVYEITVNTTLKNNDATTNSCAAFIVVNGVAASEQMYVGPIENNQSFTVSATRIMAITSGQSINLRFATLNSGEECGCAGSAISVKWISS